jgi:bifunctional non-homologous end joining protein LigD
VDEEAAAQGLEGVIAKRKASLYVPGDRSEDWRKLKLENHQEFVIGGYRPWCERHRCSADGLLR